MIKLSDYVARFVRDQGVEHVFLLPGGGNMHLADSLGKCPGLQFVCNLHEQACAMAAVAYGDMRNDLGVCAVTTGPGGTNTVTGVALAWVESVSVLCISGQAKRSDLLLGRGVRTMGQQEIDIVSIVRPITKYAVTVLEPTDIRYHLEKAVYLARDGRRGPVWIDVPLDVQAAMVDEAALRPFDPSELAVPPASESLAAQVSRTIAMLNASQRPVILAGYGIRSAGAEEEFAALLQGQDIPLLTTWKTIDLVPEEHRLFVGRPGAVGQRGANFTQQNCDCLLAVGARLDLPQTAFNHANFARAARKIIVDIDPCEIRKLDMKIELPVVADAGDFLREFLEQKSSLHTTSDHRAWLKRCKQWQRQYPSITQEHWSRRDGVDQYALTDVLSDELSADDVIAPGSSGPTSDILLQAFRIKAGQRFRNFPGLGAMGTGLPGSIGACLASGRRRTICPNGDGGFQLNIQELETIRRLTLPIKFFVLNNGGYASIMGMQRNYFQGHYVGSEPSSGLTLPNILKVAEAYGLATARIARHDELRDGVRRVLAMPGPVVCEVVCSLEQTIAPRATSSVRPDGTIVSRPMEDLWPLLDREEFRANMLIPPLEP